MPDDNRTSHYKIRLEPPVTNKVSHKPLQVVLNGLALVYYNFNHLELGTITEWPRTKNEIVITYSIIIS